MAKKNKNKNGQRAANPDYGTKQDQINISPIGSTGLMQFGGYTWYEDPIRELQGDRWFRILKEMIVQDAVVGGVLFAIKMMIRRVEWDVTPDDSKSDEDANAAEFISDCLGDMEQTWGDTLSEILGFLPWGFSLFEIVYKFRDGNQDPTPEMDDQGRMLSRSISKFDDGKIGWRGWQPRAQETRFRWEFTEDGQCIGMYQMAPPKYVLTYIPLEKCLHFRTDSRKVNPEGYSILRNSYESWYYARNLKRIEAIGAERDLAGIPVAKIPANMITPDGQGNETESFKMWKRIVTNIRQDQQAGVVMPSDVDENGHPLYELVLLSAGGHRQFDLDKVIQRYETRMAMSLLADFIFLGHSQKTGSHALAADKTDFFTLAVSAWLDYIADVINEQGIVKLLKINNIKGKCKVTHGKISDVDLATLGGFVGVLAQAGVNITYPEAQSYLRGAADFPEASEVELGGQGQQQPGVPGQPPGATDPAQQPAGMKTPQPGSAVGTPPSPRLSSPPGAVRAAGESVPLSVGALNGYVDYVPASWRKNAPEQEQFQDDDLGDDDG